VSHQIKALESELGVQLFKRRRNGLVITDAGRDYLAVVHDVFDRLELGTDRLLQRQRSGTIIVSTSPDFAAKWLVARLGRFAEAHPEIELRLSATMHHVDFAGEDVDLAIRHGNGNWPGLDAVNLTAEELFPVCSPSLMTNVVGFMNPKMCCGFRCYIWTTASIGRAGSKQPARQAKAFCMVQSSTTQAC